MCGTINPTNPINPTLATDIPVKKQARAQSFNLFLGISTPKFTAKLSPS